MSLLEQSIRLGSSGTPPMSPRPTSRSASSPASAVGVAVNALIAVTASTSTSSATSASLDVSSSSDTSASLTGSNAAVESQPHPSERTPLANLSRSPSLTLEGESPEPDGGSSHPIDADVQIIVEALKSKDRLYVLKLGELMEGLLKDRRLRVDLQPSTTYQRLLVHRCSAYYRLRPETDPATKNIFVVPTPESRIPSRRLCELVPPETAPHPTFKIMARNTGARRSKPNSHSGSIAGEEADSSDIEPSEAGSNGGKNANGMRKRPTIEEREAAYNEARSRIFMDFEEKDRGFSASSSTQSLTSGSASTSGGGGTSSASDIGKEDFSCSPTTESEWSGPLRDKKYVGSRRASGNASVASSSSRSLRSNAPPFTTSSASSSSRGSRASSPSFTYASLHEPPAPAVPPPFDPVYGHAMPPPGMYPGSGYGGGPVYYYPPPVGQHPQFMMQYPPYYPYPPPPPQTSSDPGTPVQGTDMYAHSQTQHLPYGQPSYGWAPPGAPPSAHQSVHPAQTPPHPQHPLSPSGPQPPHLQKDPPYPNFIPAPYMYPAPGYAGHHPPPVHPTAPGLYGTNVPQQPMYEMPRTMHGIDPGGFNRSGEINGRSGPGQPLSVHGPGNASGSSSNSSVSHSRASSRSSMGSGMVHGNSNGHGKGRAAPIPPVARQAWSYGPGIGVGGQYPYNGGTDSVGPRLSSRRLSGTSMSSSHGGRSSGGDEASSTASSSTSSSSRRTYTSTASSQHPLPARPDWAVGLKPQPTLASHNHHGRQHEHLSTNSSRNMSPISPPRNLHNSNGASLSTAPQPILHSTDFPPLSGTDQEKEKRAPVAGAWTNSSSIRSVFTPPKPAINGQGTNYPTSTNRGQPVIHGPKVDDLEFGFERPPPNRATELYNPKAARRAQNQSAEDVVPGGGAHSSDKDLNGEQESELMLANQVGAMTLREAVFGAGLDTTQQVPPTTSSQEP